MCRVTAVCDSTAPLCVAEIWDGGRGKGLAFGSVGDGRFPPGTIAPSPTGVSRPQFHGDLEPGAEGGPFAGEGQVNLCPDQIVQDFLSGFVKSGAETLFILILAVEADVVAALLGKKYMKQMFLGIEVECVHCVSHKYQLQSDLILRVFIIHAKLGHVKRGN